MPKPAKKHCLGTAIHQVKKFLKSYGCRLVEAEDIVDRRRDVAMHRGEDWAWVDRWAAEAPSKWINNMETLVFEVPLGNLTGSKSLNFAQDMWMLQPNLFAYMVSGDRGFVRMWWDPLRSAFPGQGTW
jgi:hypothetical protein